MEIEEPVSWRRCGNRGVGGGCVFFLPSLSFFVTLAVLVRGDLRAMCDVQLSRGLQLAIFRSQRGCRVQVWVNRAGFCWRACSMIVPCCRTMCANGWRLKQCRVAWPPMVSRAPGVLVAGLIFRERAAAGWGCVSGWLERPAATRYATDPFILPRIRKVRRHGEPRTSLPTARGYSNRETCRSCGGARDVLQGPLVSFLKGEVQSPFARWSRDRLLTMASMPPSLMFFLCSRAPPPPGRRTLSFTYTTTLATTTGIIATTPRRDPRRSSLPTGLIVCVFTAYGLSYVSTISIVVCLLSAGYIIFAYASPAYKRRQSRLNYEAIGGGANGAATPVSGARVGATVQPGGMVGSSLGSSGGGPQGGSSQSVGGGLGWKAYGSTDDAPGGAGCLPQTSSR